MPEIIIIGGGIAGFQAAYTCRTLWPEKSVTLVDKEQEIGYYRALLPQFMAGALAEERLFFWRGTDDPLLNIRPGCRVQHLDRDNGVVLLAGGETIPYERLILAQGGEPYLPETLAGPPCAGIFPVRNFHWARKAREWLAAHRKIIVFGGSLVAVKTAVHLRQAGYEVTMVVRRGHILLRAISAESAVIVEDHLRKMGIVICVQAPLEEIHMQKGQIKALKAGGTWLNCDTLLVAAGITPDVSFLTDSGLLTEGELLVAPTLQTRDPRIFAAGDCVAIASDGRGNLRPQTWPQAVVQGKLAALNLYGTTLRRHVDETSVNVIELHGLAMVILGPPIPGAEVMAYARPEEGIRRELFLLDGRPAGGALIGDISVAGALYALIKAGRQLTSREARLLKIHPGGVISFPAREKLVSADYEKR